MPFTSESQPLVRGKTGPAPGTRQAPELLRDLRWAYKHLGDEEKGTPQQERFREMNVEEPSKFLSLYTKQEELWAVAKEKAKVVQAERPEQVEDEPVDVMIRQLLEGYRNAVA